MILSVALLHLVPNKIAAKSTVTSDPSSHIINSQSTVHEHGRVRPEDSLLPPLLPSHTNLLPVMVMPVDTHWKMPTPGTKFSVMTGSKTSFTFILRGNRHMR